jgi:hypothetical protein
VPANDPPLSIPVRGVPGGWRDWWDDSDYHPALRTRGAATERRQNMRAGLRASCGNYRHGCGAGNECCPGKCFRSVRTSDELCCSGADLIICGNTCCQKNVGQAPCDCCLDPGATTEIAAAADSCPGGIAGSYRRW